MPELLLLLTCSVERTLILNMTSATSLMGLFEEFNVTSILLMHRLHEQLLDRAYKVSALEAEDDSASAKNTVDKVSTHRLIFERMFGLIANANANASSVDMVEKERAMERLKSFAQLVKI